MLVEVRTKSRRLRSVLISAMSISLSGTFYSISTSCLYRITRRVYNDYKCLIQIFNVFDVVFQYV